MSDRRAGWAASRVVAAVLLVVGAVEVHAGQSAGGNDSTPPVPTAAGTPGRKEPPNHAGAGRRPFAKREHGAPPPPDSVDGDAAAPAPALPPKKKPVEVRVLAEHDAKIAVADHEGAWSLHAETVNTDVLMRLWHEAGGPDMVSKTIIDRPYTISVHQLAGERIVERLLDGYGFTMHYDAAGRLNLVRVYSPGAAPFFKTPRLVESLTRWNEQEVSPPVPTTDGGAPVASPEGGDAAEPASDVASVAGDGAGSAPPPPVVMGAGAVQAGSHRQEPPPEEEPAE